MMQHLQKHKPMSSGGRVCDAPGGGRRGGGAAGSDGAAAATVKPIAGARGLSDGAVHE
ncbi:hypothetical protein GOP47_0031105, partial [Adiantum capillus-veneris]